jgi:hypothetical protein
LSVYAFYDEVYWNHLLWAEEDANHEDKGWNESRTKLQTPRDISSILDDDIGAETEEDTCTQGLTTYH